MQEVKEIASVREELNANTLFGKLCVELRERKEIILLSLLNTAKHWEIVDGTFVLSMSNAVEYTTIRKEKHTKLIQEIVGLPLRIELLKEEEIQSLEEYLKEKIEGLIID